MLFHETQFGSEVPKIVCGQTEPPLFQPDRDFAVLGGLGGLTASRIELCFDFIDNIGQSFEVLSNAFELSLSFDFP